VGDVFLRALDEQDLEQTYQWHNDPELYHRLGGTIHFVSRMTEKEWLARKTVFSNQEIMLAICLREDGSHIGNIYLRNLDWVARNGELQIFLGNGAERGKGHGYQAMQLLIKHAFLDLGLIRIYLFVLEDNPAAIQLYRRCGFQLEGKLRQHTFNNGVFKDYLLMGLCKGIDWIPPTEET